MVCIIPLNGFRIATRFIIFQEFLPGKKEILTTELEEQDRMSGIFYVAQGVDRFHDLFIFFQFFSNKGGHVETGHIREASYARHQHAGFYPLVHTRQNPTKKSAETVADECDPVNIHALQRRDQINGAAQINGNLDEPVTYIFWPPAGSFAKQSTIGPGCINE